MKTKGNPYGCTNYTDSILPMEKWDDHIVRHKLKELLERHKAGHKVVVKIRVFCEGEECAACKDYWKDFRIIPEMVTTNQSLPIMKSLTSNLKSDYDHKL